MEMTGLQGRNDKSTFLTSIMKQQINGTIEVKDLRTYGIVNVALSVIVSLYHLKMIISNKNNNFARASMLHINTNRLNFYSPFKFLVATW